MATAAKNLDLTERRRRNLPVVAAVRACGKVPLVRCAGVVLLACSVHGNGAERGFGQTAVARERWRRRRSRGENERGGFSGTPLPYLFTARSNGQRIFRATISVTGA
jgi:hypothetical protein